MLLFARDKRRTVELTDAGRVFVNEVRLAIFHAQRALNLARADCQAGNSLVIGYSPDADHDWVSGILATRCPSYPNVRIRLCTRFAMDLVHDVLVGELNLALVTAPPEEDRITAKRVLRPTPSSLAVPVATASLDISSGPENTVVTVKSETCHGTGFFVDSNGLVLTNQHVVGNSRYLAVQFDRSARSLPV